MTILDDEFDTKAYNQAIINYGALIPQVRNFSLKSNLAKYSCPTSNLHVTVSI